MENTASKTILIADDEIRMRRVIADYLHIKGYETLEAGDGVEALSLFESGRPDLILLDVMMPRMDGWEVCRHIRSKSQVPIIMLTARSEEDDELQGFSLGVDEYIAKPFSLKILLARIEAVFRRGAPEEPAARPVVDSGVALSRDKILDSVWRYDYYGDARTVDTHVKKLRSKLGRHGDCIKTIRGIGYKFEPDAG